MFSDEKLFSKITKPLTENDNWTLFLQQYIYFSLKQVIFAQRNLNLFSLKTNTT
ncbi:hypothetical protein B0I10_103152 [Flavobacterium lacus]|jgi:hypothetical protein|uniref:Uncharacterized protein n=1 Tax=Flavobacterium lacus TaxID=1353778 RepID=A0A328WU20_9FLAO|nr:hypothetical protein B0I10_103152 [Flavobacterium lacus]